MRRLPQALLGTVGLALTLAWPAASAPAVQATQKLALLVGVSHYKNLVGQDLKGPDNDTALMQELLTARGFQVKVLGGPRNPQPTRAAIILAMQQLAQRAGTGDFVFLLFSGHGSQQPQGAVAAVGGCEPKPDGMDETFIPTDVGQWNGEAMTVSGALLDHEVCYLIHAIRNKGAFVWSVFDSCHSATMTRAALLPKEHDRRILPEVLGVPAVPTSNTASSKQSSRSRATGVSSSAASPRSGFVEPVPLLPGAGGSVAFYAAQTAETAPELPLPENAADGKYYGLFSFALHQAIGSTRSSSYRQLAQYILQFYAAMNRDSPTPIFEGDLGQMAFGDPSAPMVRQWRLRSSSTGLILAAGLLDQLGPGDLLLVVPPPSPRDLEPIGVVQIDEALQTVSHVEWVSEPALLQSSGWTPRAGTGHPKGLPDGSFARLAVSRVRFDVRVARPLSCRTPVTGTVPQCTAGDAGPNPDIFSLVTQAFDVHAPNFPPNATVVGNSDPAEIRPLLYRARLWLAPPGAQLITDGPAQTYSIPVAVNGIPDPLGELRNALFEALARQARAINLARVAASRVNEALGLEVRMSVEPKSGSGHISTTLVQPGATTLRDGDQVTFELSNHGVQPLDVTMLDIGAHFGIDAVYPSEGESNRLSPGTTTSVPGTVQVKPGDSGRETMLIIATPGLPGEERRDFSGLAQPPLLADRSAKKSNGQGVGALLWQAAFGANAHTRAPPRHDPAELLSYSWDTRPGTP